MQAADATILGTRYPDLFSALAAPFEPQEVRVRTQGGKQLHYITARTAMNRLDDVLGPENWWDEYLPSENSVLCKLTMRLPDGSTVTKCDAGGYAGMADSGDDDKSGFSDAFKRAAAKFGVARYLYRDGVPSFVQHREPEGQRPPTTTANGHAGGDPHGPPKERHEWDAAKTNGNGHAAGGGKGNGVPPRTGRALFAWTKGQEQRHEIDLLKYLNRWAKLQDYPGRMVDWDAEQVGLAHAEAVRKIQAVSVGQAEAYDEAMSA